MHSHIVMHSHLVLASVFFWKFCCGGYAFLKNVIFSSHASICFFGAAHFIHSLFPLFWFYGFIVVEHVKTYIFLLVVNLHGCMGHLARNNRMLDIFSRKKKKVRIVTQMFHLLDIFLNAFSYCYAFSACFSICFFFSKFCCGVYAFRKM